MVCQHLKDKLTGSPRLSPLHCSLQKTFFWLHLCPHSYFTQHRSSFTSDFRIYYTLDSPICLTRSQHQTAQRVFLNPSTQDHVNTRPKKSMGGKKKSLHTQSSVTSSQALTLSAPEASLPWQPWHLQPSWQESREGDTCLQFVSWVIGPAVQGHSSPRWQQAMAVCLDTRATLSLEWISGIY